MFRLITWVLGLGIACALFGYFVILPQLGQEKSDIDVTALKGDPERGAYVLRMAGCVTCHSDGQGEATFLAGGPALKTPFGTFYGPNITPDPDHGIGRMTNQEFFDAVTAGLRPDGTHYFPAFPYASYVKMDGQDVVDLKAYLDTVPAVSKAARRHEVAWPFSDRSLVGGWKLLAIKARSIVPDAGQDNAWNRGMYLVEGAGHCGECHTDRNLLGLPRGPAHGGSPKGSFSSGAPSIAGAKSVIADWTHEDITFYLENGLKPDGDVSGGKMTQVIDFATSHLTGDDLDAIARYLLSLQTPATH